MAESQFIQDPNYSKRFPPSYVNREPFIADPTKPLPETVKSIDEKR